MPEKCEFLGEAVKLKQVKYVIFGVVFLFLLIMSAYIYVENRALPRRLIYDVEVWLTKYLAYSCNVDNAISKAALDYSLRHFSTRNQVLYFDKRAVSKCVSGWRGGIFSPKLSHQAQFAVASLTKPLTAGAVLDLVQRGRVELESTVADIFGFEIQEFRDSRVAKLTVGELLNHRLEFESNRIGGGGVMDTPGVRPWCPYEMAKLKELRLTDAEQSYHYNNLNYCILGEIIGRVTSTPFRQYMQEEAFKDSQIRFVNKLPPSSEMTYDFRFDRWFGAASWKHFDFVALSSSAGVKANVSDYVAVLLDLHRKNNSLFGFNSECKKISEGRCFSNSFEQINNYSKPYLVHTGYLPGASSLIVLDESGRGVVAFSAGSSRDQGGAWERAKYFIQLLESQ